MAEKQNWFKRIFNLVKDWVVGNGIEGILGLIAGLILWSFGFKVYAGVAFGVFTTRNWDLFKNWVSKLFK
jgi:predicted small integral membrane protein